MQHTVTAKNNLETIDIFRIIVDVGFGGMSLPVDADQLKAIFT